MKYPRTELLMTPWGGGEKERERSETNSPYPLRNWRSYCCVPMSGFYSEGTNRWAFPNLSYLLHGVPQPHDLGRLAAGLGLGGVQYDVQVRHVGELGVDLLGGVHKVLDLRHGELPGWERCRFGVIKKKLEKNTFNHEVDSSTVVHSVGSIETRQ